MRNWARPHTIKYSTLPGGKQVDPGERSNYKCLGVLSKIAGPCSAADFPYGCSKLAKGCVLACHGGSITLVNHADAGRGGLFHTAHGSPSWGTPGSRSVLVTNILGAFLWFPVAIQEVEGTEGVSMYPVDCMEAPRGARVAGLALPGTTGEVAAIMREAGMGGYPVMEAPMEVGRGNAYPLWRSVMMWGIEAARVPE